MIVPGRLLRLNPRHRMRKVATALADAERQARDGPPPDEAAVLALGRLVEALLSAPDAGLGEGAMRAGSALLGALWVGSGHEGSPVFPLRELNALRHALLGELGIPCAEWDLILQDGRSPSGKLDPSARRSFPGMAAYFEDIRSPFNLGSLFRTAEAFGAERVWLSPGCADPAHPRAERSAMGCAAVLPWERLGDGDAEAFLERSEGAFALETGGTPLEDFDFPERGLCLVGSEELGLSPQALAACGGRRVSIPMFGAKASLNVGVAFGVLMNAWAASLARRCAEGRA